MLADGSNVGYRLGGVGGGDKFVGRQLSDGYWVKAKTEGAGGAEYVLCLGEGFKLTVSRRTEREMEALTEADFVEAEELSYSFSRTRMETEAALLKTINSSQKLIELFDRIGRLCRGARAGYCA